MNADLKIVRYSGALVKPKIGCSAVVYPVDHPSDLVSNNGVPAQTSEVMSILESGDYVEFWTRNTHYVPT